MALEKARSLIWQERVRGLQHTAAEALHAAAHIAGLQAIYTQQCPHGAAFFHLIASSAVMDFADITTEAGR